MFVADQNVFLVRRREFVLRATFCTTMNVMRKKSVLTQPMTGNPARICIQGALIITTTSMKKIIKILSCISINNQEKSHNNEDENFKLSVTRFYGKDPLSCEIAEAVILRSRKGDVCNLKSEWHAPPPLVKVTRQVQRGL